MAQVSQITINNQAFSTFRTTMNDSFSALNSMHSGTSRPASATTGTLWLDTTNAGSNSLTIKFFDGSDDITFATIDTSANTVNFIDSVVTGFDIVTDTTPQLGGDLASNGHNILFADNDRAKFGTGNDLQIYHTGNESFIRDTGTGILYIDTNGSEIDLISDGSASTGKMARFVKDGAVELYHDNSKKFETTSTGATVTGVLNTQTIEVGTNTQGITSDIALNQNAVIRASANLSFVSGDSGGADDIIFFGATSGNSNQGITGATEVMRIDTSAARLGVGTSAPNTTLEVKSSSTSTGSNGNLLIQTSETNTINAGGQLTLGNTGFRRASISGRQESSSGSAGYLQLGTRGSSGDILERFRIDSSGDVGINITTPNLTPFNKAVTLSGTNNAGYELAKGSTLHGAFAVQGDDRVQLINFQNADITFNTGTSATERMRINSTGVGIGTSSPTEKLTVETTTGISIKGTGSGDGIIKLVSYAGSQNAEAQIRSARGNTSGTDSRLKFYTNNGTSTLERIDINDNGDISFYEDTGTTAKLFWDASTERLGIGTSSPSAELHLSATAPVIKTTATNTNSGLRLNIVGGGNELLRIQDDGSEVMRIDSSGNLLVGKSSLDFEGTAGIILRNDGLLHATRNGGNVTDFNRLSSDGEVVRFSKDGTTSGQINISGNRMNIGTGNTAIRFDSNSRLILPWNVTSNNATGVDNAIDLGASGGFGFKDLYLGGGVFLGGTGTSNKLDDYEEGDFTPTYEPSSGSFSSIAYQTQKGHYTKIGDVVFAYVFIRTSSLSVGTASGLLRIAGLPFTVENSNASLGVGSVSNQNGWITNAPRNILGNQNATSANLLFTDTNVYNNITPSNMSTGSGHNRINALLIYKVA